MTATPRFTNTIVFCLLTQVTLLIACSGDSSDGPYDTGSASDVAAASNDPDDDDDDDDDGDDDDNGDDDDDGDDDDGDEDDGDDDDGDDDDGDDDDGDDDDGDDDDGDDDDEPHFDIGEPDTGDGDPPGDEELEFSYIWIANTGEGTVSKIDTQTLEEVGRFQTRPDTFGSPSRTSVSRAGNVAVANRHGGVVKIYADHADCADTNGQAGIQTSTDATPLPWGQDECIAWFVAMDYGSQRAVAWTQGEKDPDTGEITDERVWVTGIRDVGGDVEIILLDGDNGSILKTATFPFSAVLPGQDVFPYGAYGGAVDRAGDFWFSNLAEGVVVRVRLDTMEIDQWDKGHDGYGLTVDSKGRVWTCSSTIGRFDPADETWQTVNGDYGLADFFTGSAGGCMVDGDGRLWFAGRPSSSDAERNAIVALDSETLEGIKYIEIPQHAHGISIDFDGNVWGVSMGESAYRVNPETEQVDEFTGLTSAYTYSDMTGFALGSTILPPVE